MKPKLLHLPCSHLIAACAESGLQPGVFVSPYFSKEAAVSTWGHEVYGIGIVEPFYGLPKQINTPFGWAALGGLSYSVAQVEPNIGRS